LDLLNQLKQKSTISETCTLSASKFSEYDEIPTEIPILNLAFSGTLDGGLSSGISMLCGDSKTFKSGMLAQMALAYQKKYKDGIVVLFDSEFSPLDYYSKAGVKMDRILHVPIKNIEELKHEAVVLLESLEVETQHCMMLVDSIGGLASKKEADDASSGSDKADMSRPKQLASLFRIITPLVNFKNVPFVMINSHYSTMELYAKKVTGGGSKPYLSSDNVWFMSRAKDKDGKEIKGYYFTLTSDKSRKVKEESKFPLHITHKDGIDKYSGLFELAVESGHVLQSGAWFQVVDQNGEINPKKTRRKEIETKEFFETLIKNKDFKNFCSTKYLLN